MHFLQKTGFFFLAKCSWDALSAVTSSFPPFSLVAQWEVMEENALLLSEMNSFLENE